MTVDMPADLVEWRKWVHKTREAAARARQFEEHATWMEGLPADSLVRQPPTWGSTPEKWRELAAWARQDARTFANYARQYWRKAMAAANG